jgi:hypothetical protein
LIAAHGQSVRPEGTDGNASLPVTVSYGDGKSIQTKTEQGIAPRIGLRPAQVVNVALQLPVERSGQSVAVVALDGGTLTKVSSTVNSDGTVRFGFEAGTGPGLYGISIQLGDNEYRVQFWVLNENHPEKNPRVPVAE